MHVTVYIDCDDLRIKDTTVHDPHFFKFASQRVSHIRKCTDPGMQAGMCWHYLVAVAAASRPAAPGSSSHMLAKYKIKHTNPNIYSRYSLPFPFATSKVRDQPVVYDNRYTSTVSVTGLPPPHEFIRFSTLMIACRVPSKLFRIITAAPKTRPSTPPNNPRLGFLSRERVLWARWDSGQSG